MPYRRRITIRRQPAGAFAPKRLSLVRGFGVQLSTAFIGMAMPPTVGHVAVNARYLHRQDVDEGTIAAAVTMSQVVNVVTTVLLLIVFGLLTGSGLSRFEIAPGADLLIGLAAIAGVIIILVAVPQTRAKLTEIVWPHLRSLGPRLLDAISHPARLAISAGANLLLIGAYLVAFIAALRAVGIHPAILPAAVVYLAGNAVGSAAPKPGGIGGVEAVLAAGLTAVLNTDYLQFDAPGEARSGVRAQAAGRGLQGGARPGTSPQTHGPEV